MADIKAQVQQVTSSIEKVIAEQTSNVEVAIGEAKKLQTESINQAGAFLQSAVRMGKDQLAFAEEITGEWRKLVLGATRNAAELFAPKKV